jgi:hypothetical protein
MVKARLRLILLILGLLAALITACSQSPTPLTSQTNTSDLPTIEEPELSTALKSDCQINQSSPHNLRSSGLEIGKIAVNFILRDIRGNEIRLSQLLAEKPVVLILGSFT